MMHMEHRQTVAQTQTLIPTQKMQQALQILQLSGLELEQFVRQELESNPFLEQKRKKEDVPEDGKSTSNKEEGAETATEEPFDLDAFADSWSNRLREGRDLSRNSDLAARRQYYEDSITQEESLRSRLLSQLRIAAKDEAEYAIGERIVIGDINDKGYFTGDVEEIAAELEVAAEAVERVLGVIQRFEPTGVGARDVVECLLLQIDAEYPEETELRTLVQHHLEELKRRQIPKIAKAMNISASRVEELRSLLATLNPWPGHEFSSGPPQYVAAEVIVDKVDDEYVVRLINDAVPEVRLNDKYITAIRSEGISKEDRAYIREKMESARWLQRNISQRQNTILKVAQAIVDVQRDFLEKGVEHIRPLKLQDIADTVGVHESTVARTTQAKYMQTPQGLFELKYFFSPGLMRDTGEAQSSKSVQAMIKKIIDEEDKRKPLSDQKIANMLKAEGINVARRTVAKYREGMGILSTTLRREYQA